MSSPNPNPGTWTRLTEDKMEHATLQSEAEHHHDHHHLSLNRKGRWGTTDDFATSFPLETEDTHGRVKTRWNIDTVEHYRGTLSGFRWRFHSFQLCRIEIKVNVTTFLLPF